MLHPYFRYAGGRISQPPRRARINARMANRSRLRRSNSTHCRDIPGMLGACKSSGRYDLTLIGPNPETESIPVRFRTRAATFLDFCTATIRVIMRLAAVYVARAR